MLDQPPVIPPPLPGERQSFVTVDGVRLRVRELGDRSALPIVLLHGLRGYSGTWRKLAAVFADRYRLIALDQRGRGDSGWDPDGSYYTARYVKDLEGVVDVLALPRFFLLGHSMGGTTSYVYADRHPERLYALLIEDIAPGSSISGAGAGRIVDEMKNLPLSFESWSQARDYWRQLRPSLAPAAIEERVAESLREDGSGRIVWRYDAEGIARVRLNPDPAHIVDLWAVVQSLSVPTLVIRGGRSDFCPADTVGEMTRRNTRIGSVTVPEASHYVHDDAPDLFAELVGGFLMRSLDESRSVSS